MGKPCLVPLKREEQGREWWNPSTGRSLSFSAAPRSWAGSGSCLQGLSRALKMCREGDGAGGNLRLSALSGSSVDQRAEKIKPLIQSLQGPVAQALGSSSLCVWMSLCSLRLTVTSFIIFS